MFRDNEASRVGEVLECKERGDRAGAVAAALQLWLTPVERPGEEDTATYDTWRAIEAMGAVPQAVAASLVAVRGRRVLRPHAFIDLVERIADPKLLLELADLALDGAWPIHPYLATICFALVDAGHEAAMWTWIGERGARLTSLHAWVLIGVFLLTTPIGTEAVLAGWFAGIDAHAGVPLWVVAGYMATLMQLDHVPKTQIAMIAMAALGRCTLDATFAFVCLPYWLLLIAGGNHAEFFAQYREHHERVRPAPVTGRHPMIFYINTAKHRYRVGPDDFRYLVTGAWVELRPANVRAASLVCEGQAMIENAGRLFPLLDELDRAERGSRRAVQLHRALQNAQAASMKSIVPLWRRLEQEKVGWFARLWSTYF